MFQLNDAVDTTAIEPTVRALAKADSADENSFKRQLLLKKTSPNSFAGFFIGEASAFVKCYMPKNYWRKWLSFSLPVTTFRPYRLAKTLAEQLPIPQPLAVVRNRNSGNVYYFSERLAGVDLASASKTQQLDAQLYTATVAEQLAEFHQLGWAHGDFKWGNILITPENNLYFIDLDSLVSTRGLLGNRRRLRDVARFVVNVEDYNLSKSIIDVFIASYAEKTGNDAILLLRQLKPTLQKFRNRHDKKYGTRQADLI